MSNNKSKAHRKPKNDESETFMDDNKPGCSDGQFDLSKFRDSAFEELSLSLTENANPK